MNILQNPRQFAERLHGRRIALFLDYDGTLTPIVERPERAMLSEPMRSAIRRAAERLTTLAVISGRDLPDVRGMVGLENLVYAGSHGYDIQGPGGLRMQQEAAQDCLPELDAAEQALRGRLADIKGCHVERKRFAIAVHYRQVDETDVPAIEGIVQDVQREHTGLRMRGGKKIFELQPDVEWDKGRAVLWLLGALELEGPDILPIYVGDDVTDEDAFEALQGRGIGICVDCENRDTLAEFSLTDPEQVREFLQFFTTQGSRPERFVERDPQAFEFLAGESASNCEHKHDNDDNTGETGKATDG